MTGKTISPLRQVLLGHAMLETTAICTRVATRTLRAMTSAKVRHWAG